MDLNDQAEQAISALFDAFPLTTSGEVLAFARQAWYRGYEAGMNATNAKVEEMFGEWAAMQIAAQS